MKKIFFISSMVLGIATVIIAIVKNGIFIPVVSGKWGHVGFVSKENMIMFLLFVGCSITYILLPDEASEK